MNVLSSIVTYVRRIIKSPSDSEISDALIIDYINRFWIMDVDARIQLFDLKTKYQFQTVPGFDQYNMPLYNLQTEPGPQSISYYPVYQGFESPAYINGIQVPLQTEKSFFFNVWPNIVQLQNTVAVGDGGATYNFKMPIAPGNQLPFNTPLQYLLRGHVDITGVIANANGGTISDPILGTTINTAIPTTSIYPAVYINAIGADGSPIQVSDSGQFLTNHLNFGLLMHPDAAPYGNAPLSGGYSTTMNTINYFTGEVNVTMPANVPQGVNINAQCYFYQTGLPRMMLFNNNTLLLRSPPDQAYLVELDAYLTPAAFLNSNQALEFAYMAEYIARGAARKIMSDTGDIEQLAFYETFFKEQEMLVWKRSQRQFTASRTQTIYSQGINQGQSGFNNVGGSTI